MFILTFVLFILFLLFFIAILAWGFFQGIGTTLTAIWVLDLVFILLLIPTVSRWLSRFIPITRPIKIIAITCLVVSLGIFYQYHHHDNALYQAFHFQIKADRTTQNPTFTGALDYTPSVLTVTNNSKAPLTGCDFYINPGIYFQKSYMLKALPPIAPGEKRRINLAAFKDEDNGDPLDPSDAKLESITYTCYLLKNYEMNYFSIDPPNTKH